METLSAEVRASLQNRLIKKTSELIDGFNLGMDIVDDQFGSWADYIAEYGELHFVPVQIEVNPSENAMIEDFVQTENELFGKIIVALSAITCELRFLVREARQKILNPLLHYSEDNVSSTPNLAIGKFIAFLQKLVCFKARCKEVVVVFLKQLNALVERDVSFGSTAFFYQILGELFICLITIDSIVKSNNALREHWTSYKTALNACAHSAAACGKIGTTYENMKEIETLVTNIEKEVLSEAIFADCIQEASKIPVGKKFLDNFSTAFSSLITEAENSSTSGQDSQKFSLKVLSIGSLFVFICAISRTVEKRFLKSFLDLSRLAPIVPLWQNISICPSEAVLKLIPDIGKYVDRKQPGIITAAKEAVLQLKLQTLPRDVATFRMEAMEWVGRIQNIAKQTEPTIDDDSPKFLRSGLILAQRVQATIVQLFHYHSVTLKPLSRSTLLNIGQLLEIQMVLNGCHQYFNLTLAQLLERQMDLLTNRILTICQNLEKRLAMEKRNSREQVDAYTALIVLQQALSGPATESRSIVAHVCLGICFGVKKWPMEDFNLIYTNYLPVVNDFRKYFASFQLACDTSMFFWNRQVLRPYLDDVYQNPVYASKLFCFIKAFEYSAKSLASACHEQPKVLMMAFGNEIRQNLEVCILDKLCKEIETNLRLLVHSHLSLPDRSPFDSTVRDLRMFLGLAPVRFFDHCVDFKDYVENYLDRTFYDLTTVALHDWKTYDEMRTLAAHLYGLNVMQAHLPCQTLEQGADILEIMRNIHIFVSSYAYNLNNQVFVERISNSKHLNTIGIRHVANSLRTHGIGVMNTTVNYTYQFLRKKFNLFSQFMFDEHIKSRLIKDIKAFKDRKQADAMARYPFEKAEKFNKDIRTLGVTADGQTRLDQFRVLITHIGNAMGFVRTVRSGGLHHCSKAICFVPDLEDIESFEILSKEDNIGFQNTTGKDLDEVVAMLNRNLSDGTEFFKMVNFVEHLVTCKERLHKKNPSGLVLFTDDGFAMGLAYILALLDQNQQFDSLNWIDAVRDKLAKDAAAADSSKPQSSGRSDGENDEKLRQALSLTARRLDSYSRDFELLFFNLSSARIFFKAGPKVLSVTEAAEVGQVAPLVSTGAS